MLRLTKRADYGLIALRHLALRPAGSATSAKELADEYRIPLPLLAKVLQKLVRGGLLRSAHGTNGGYRLGRQPEQITALQAIRAIDGPVFLAACLTEHTACEQSDRCPVREPLRKVHEGILGLLDGLTVAELARTEEDEDGSPARRPELLAVLPN